MNLPIIPIYYFPKHAHHTGYIAGAEDGIVTVNVKPASRKVYLLDAFTLKLLRVCPSLDNGRYMFTGLDPNKEYLVMCRDYNKDYEPFCYDYIKPSTNLTVVEQMELWQSWLTN